MLKHLCSSLSVFLAQHLSTCSIRTSILFIFARCLMCNFKKDMLKMSLDFCRDVSTYLMPIKYTGQAVSKESILEKWFCDWSKLLVSFLKFLVVEIYWTSWTSSCSMIVLIMLYFIQNYLFYPDVYLAGTVMLIFAMGLYGLFISNVPPDVPPGIDRALKGSSLFGMFALKVLLSSLFLFPVRCLELTVALTRRRGRSGWKSAHSTSWRQK